MLEHASYVVEEVKKGERMKKAPLPFTTSTLQQEAAKVLNFSTQKTMRLAQQLYEGVELKGSGTVGLITYLRTDSTRICGGSRCWQRECILRSIMERSMWQQRVAAAKRSGKKIQDAHEAIRPTDLSQNSCTDERISCAGISSVCIS